MQPVHLIIEGTNVFWATLVRIQDIPQATNLTNLWIAMFVSILREYLPFE